MSLFYEKPKPKVKAIVAIVKDNKLLCYKQNKKGVFKLPYKEAYGENVSFSSLGEAVLKELGITATEFRAFYDIDSNDRNKTEAILYSYVSGDVGDEHEVMWLEPNEINREYLILEPEYMFEEIQKMLKKQHFSIVLSNIDEKKEKKLWSNKCSLMEAELAFIKMIREQMKTPVPPRRIIYLYDEHGQKIAQESFH